jgi:transglutaminase-like putative cysteine protease
MKKFNPPKQENQKAGVARLEFSSVMKRLIALCIGFQAFAFFSIAPVWVLLFLGIFSLYIFWPKLAAVRFVRGGVIISCLVSFGLTYGKAYSVEMAAVFLLLVCCMKATEILRMRDVLVFVYTMFYLSAVSFLFEQGIGHVLLELSVLVFCLGLLMLANGVEFGSLRGQFSGIAKLLAVALPFAVVFFLFFPRMAPLWSLPIKTSHAKTGMSEEMSPGDIADLSQSAERVFRATFSESLSPKQHQLYWRAMVLDQFDGRTWRRGVDRLNSQRFARGISYGAKYEEPKLFETQRPFYDVMMDPHQERWAYALNGSERASNNIHEIGLGAFEFKLDVVSPTPYRLILDSFGSSVDGLATAMKLSGSDAASSPLAQDVALPRSVNPKTRALVDSILRAGPTESEFVRRLLEMFATEGFAYTLKPPLLGDNSIDEFLFSAKRGFCEHYASSLAFMLRSADIPARIVLGYQGGEYNAELDYWLIRQYDAHAWVEAYISGLGWVRLDPTALIAPDRIAMNLEAAVAGEGTFLSESPFTAFSRANALLSWVMRKSDEVNYRWQKWVVGYGESSQISLISNLFGEFSWRLMLWFMLGLLGVLSCATVLYFWLGRYRSKLSKPERRFLRFVAFLRAFGVRRELGETPRALVARTRPTLRPSLHRPLAQRAESLEKDLYT